MPDELMWDPGWFSDPTGRHDHRWWDGAAWTAHVADAGVAAKDPLDAHPRGPMGPGGADRRTVDPLATVGLVSAIIAVPISLLPIIGLIPAIAAVVVAVIARSRVRRSSRKGEGVAIAGLVISIGALVVAAIVTIVAISVFAGSGSELQEAFRAYADCLEVDSQADCRMRLEQELSRMVR
jgi:hypothetical protein